MNKQKILLFSLAFILILPISVLAFEIKTNETVIINKDQIIDGNLYAAGSLITVDGTVRGDVFCGGETININGQIDGDIICAGKTVNINSSVGGNVRIVGETLIINGSIDRGIIAAGANTTLGSEAVVGWDMLWAGARADIRGKIGRDFYGGGANVLINGEIGRDVKLRLDERITKDTVIKIDDYAPLNILDEANIEGNVYYTSGIKGTISENASIAGEIGHSLPEKKQKKEGPFDFGLWGLLVSIFSALVVGLVIISIWRKEILELTNNMLEKISPSIGWGVVIMIITPIIVVLLLFTLIGIPLALITFVIWLIALYISKIFVGILVGKSLMDKFGEKKESTTNLIWPMIIGVALCWIIFAIPVIGWLLSLISIWWGLGGIWLYSKKQ
jgi:cytoskeletal protein CcmA (bactofilin family)